MQVLKYTFILYFFLLVFSNCSSNTEESQTVETIAPVNKQISPPPSSPSSPAKSAGITKGIQKISVDISPKEKSIIKVLDQKFTAVIPDKKLDIASVPTEESKYFALLSKALNLKAPKRRRLKKILLEFRTKKKGANEQKLKRLVSEREAAYVEILSPIEMEQKKFITLKFNKFQPKNPKHLINLQTSLSLSDAEMLKYIEVITLFKYNRDQNLRDERLTKVLGDAKFKELGSI